MVKVIRFIGSLVIHILKVKVVLAALLCVAIHSPVGRNFSNDYSVSYVLISAARCCL